MEAITSIIELFYSIVEIFKEPDKTFKQKLLLSAVFTASILFVVLILWLFTLNN